MSNFLRMWAISNVTKSTTYHTYGRGYGHISRAFYPPIGKGNSPSRLFFLPFLCSFSFPFPSLPFPGGPTPESLGVWGSAVSSPSGVWGKAPAEKKRFRAYLSLKSCSGAIVSAKYLIVEFVVMNKHLAVHSTLQILCHLY